MMRDGDRIDHMLSFTRRCIEVLDGVDKAQFLICLHTNISA